MARISADSQAYCTYGTASPGPLLFTPADDFGNPLPPPVNIGNDQPSDGQAQQQDAKPNEIKPNVVRGDDEPDLYGTHGPDVMTGGKGEHTFRFRVEDRARDNPYNTLDDGDRITDYKSGEKIIFTGIEAGDVEIKLTYDPEKNETHLEIYFKKPGPLGKFDVKPNKTILLNGDKRGKTSVDNGCCVSWTEIKITLPDTDGKPQQQADKPNEVRSADNSENPENKSGGSSKSSGPKGKNESEEANPPHLDLNREDKPPSILKFADKNVVPASEPPPKTDTIAQAADGTKPEAEITLIFKVTDEVLHGQPSGSELKKTDLVKLVTKDPPLPKTGGSKLVQDKGFASSPVACVTDSNHECRAKLPGADRELYGFPVSDQRIYQTDFAMRRNNGVVIEEDGKTETALPQVTSEVTLTATGFKIGDKTFKRIAINAPEFSVPGILEKLREAFGPRLQIDYCGEKKPGPPLGMEPLSYSSLNSELPKAEVRLGP